MPFIPQPAVDTEFKRKLTLPPHPPAARETPRDAAEEILAGMEAAHAAMRASGKIEAAATKALKAAGRTNNT